MKNEYNICFPSTRDTINEKFITIIKYLVERELVFRMNLDRYTGSRSLIVIMNNDEVTRFKREFTRLGYWLQ